MSPTATVLLPVYNAESYLRESIESILAQTHRALELLLINDASTDRSGEMLDQFAARYASADRPIRVIHQEQNRGLIGTFNHGLELATGDWIFRHDADDIAHPKRLERSFEALKQNPAIVLLGSAIDRIDSKGHPLTPLTFPASDSEIRWQLLFRNPFVHSTVAYRRDQVRSLGGYPVNGRHGEDYALWTSLATLGKLANMTEPLCTYRVHQNSYSANYRTEAIQKSAQVGADWFATLLSQIHFDRDLLRSRALWEAFRLRSSLSVREVLFLTQTLRMMIARHPDFAELDRTRAIAQFTEQVFRYAKGRVKVHLGWAP